MKKNYFLFICVIVLPFLFISTVAAAEKREADEKSAAPGASSGSYQINAGDVLEISTWKEPDLSREEVIVRGDGYISFPLIDDIRAAGLGPTQLKEVIEENLKEFVATPVVTVTIRSPNSQRFYILGEIMRTGEYPLIKRLTVLQAFAMAGGFTEWAAKKEILLLRKENGQDKVYRINYKNILKGKDFSSNINIKADDTIIVP